MYSIELILCERLVPRSQTTQILYFQGDLSFMTKLGQQNLNMRYLWLDGVLMSHQDGNTGESGTHGELTGFVFF